jgi:hypothetical protein
MTTVTRSRSRDPKSTVSALMAEIDVIQRKIGAMLDGMVEIDRRSCPGVPEGVVRNLRMANFRGGFCWCSWLRNEAAQLKMEKRVQTY